ncbi:MAG: hypothetical protein KJZ70_10555 [Bryobacterales bacterium]|nr:hypothetical protein [Bryobacterales bacterium]
MHRRSLALLALTFLVALAPAYGAFLNDDIGGTTELVDFNQFDSGYATMASNPVQVFQNGGFTVSMNTPNAADSGQTVIYGFGGPVDYYLVNQTQPGDPVALSVEFNLAGGTVSSIGIRLATFSDNFHTPIVLEIFDASEVLLESHAFNGWVGSGSSQLDPGGFFGFEIGTASIARLRVTGGTIELDDLRFGGLSTDGGEPDPDPSAVPEASTFLLCGTALGLLSLAGRFRRKAGSPRQ